MVGNIMRFIRKINHFIKTAFDRAHHLYRKEKEKLVDSSKNF